MKQFGRGLYVGVIAVLFAGGGLAFSSRPAAQTTNDRQTADRNVAVVRQFWDAFNRQAWSDLDALTTTDYVHHTNGGSAPLLQFKRGGMRVHNGMGGYHLTIDDAVASGDRVAVRWTAHGTHDASLFGEVPTGKALTVYGMHMHRLVNGRIAEDWEVIDTGNIRDQISAH